MKTSARLLVGGMALAGMLAATALGGPVTASPSATPNDNASATAPPLHKYPTVQIAHAQRSATPAADNLTFHGGPVLTTGFKTYLVFWGSQWGTGTAETALSNDVNQIAPLLIKLFQGLGSTVPDNDPNKADPYERFSNTNKWYCTGVGLGTNGLDPNTGCDKQPAASHVGYPTDGALNGIWNDTATAEPDPATQSQLAQEADRAAAHFGQSANANAQYIIVSGHNTHPDGFFNGQWCAWHSYSNFTTTIHHYTNLPYLPDAGGSCGANFVNASSPNDGVTIVAGHEFSETVTDPQLNAWWDPTTGQENSDKCAWVSGSPNASANAQNVKLKTGTLPLQSNWLNKAEYNGVQGSCAISSK